MNELCDIVFAPWTSELLRTDDELFAKTGTASA